MTRRKSGIRGWSVFIFLFAPILAFSQAFTNISGVHYTTENGLPGSVVYDVIQDANGFIWIGTETGLARFDGTEFVQYSILDGLPESDILALYLDKQNKLWVHCLSSVAYFDNAKGRFVKVPLPGIHEVVSVFLDSRGNLWATGRSELCKLIHASPDSIVSIVDPRIIYRPYLIGEDQDGNVLLKLTRNKMISVEENGTLSEFPHSFTRALWLHPFITLNHPDLGLLINSRTGLRQLANSEVELIPELSDIPVSVLRMEKDGSIWAGGHVNGVRYFKYHPETRTFSESLHLLTDQRINNILEDRDGNLWISTLGNGVFFFPSSIKELEVWNPESIDQDPTIYSLIYSSDSCLWMGGINSVMAIKSDERVLSLPTPNNFRNYNRVLQLEEIKPGTIQAVTDLGISQIEDFDISLYSNISSVKSVVYSDSGYWMAGRNGFTFLRAEEIESKRYPGVFTPSIDSSFIKERMNVIQPSDSGFWLGGVSGLYHYSPEKTISFPDDSGFFTPIITDILTDEVGRVWVSTNGGGLVCKKGESLQRYLTSSGLASLNCRKLLYFNGLLLVGTNQGLTIFDVSDPNMPPSYLSTLTNIDGLPSVNIFDIILQDKLIYLGTANGVCRFPIDFIYQTVTRQQVYFSQIRVDDELLPELSNGQSFELTKNSSSLFIKFSTIDFTGSSNLEYRYKLEGIDEDWVYSRASLARYTSIPFGEFTFLVQAKRTNNQSWPTTSSELTFLNPAPFWATWWFFFLMVFLGIGLFILIQQQLLRRVETRNLQALVDQQTSQLLSSNAELERSNKELKEFAYVVSHDLKSPLRTISSFAQLVQKRGKKEIPGPLKEYLDLIVQGSQKMNHLIEDLLTYAQIGGKNETFHPVDLHFILKEVIRNLEEDIRLTDAKIQIHELPKLTGIRHQLSLLFQNLLENAIKFRDEDPPHIEIGMLNEPDSLVVYVRDNGIGVPEKYQEEILKIFKRLNPEQYSGTGIGLSICQKIMNVHEGTLEIVSREGEGSTFYLRFPISSQLTAEAIPNYPYGT